MSSEYPREIPDCLIMKVDLHPCYILHRRPYRETSLLLDIFSSMHGRMGLVARGAKRRKDNQANLLQAGRKLNLSWSSRGDLGTLTGVETYSSQVQPAGTRLISIFYMNELLVRMLHQHESHPELFSIYEQSMIKFGNGEPEDRILRIFELHLLRTLGYGPVLDHEVETGESIRPEQGYYFRLDSGPTLKKHPGSKNIPVSGKTLLALSREDVWDSSISSEAKALLRAILAAHTGEKPLGSKDLYRAYLKNTQAGQEDNNQV